MESILYILIVLGILVITFLGPRVRNMQSVTLWAGKKIAPSGLEKEAPNGFQDSITPESQNKGNITIMLSYLVLLISGSLIVWYGGIIAIIIAMILSNVSGKFQANDIGTYLLKLINSMSNRIADYKKNNDFDRAEAGEEMLQKLQILYAEINEQNLAIPSFKELKEMKLGE